jgi:hypothetical protein
MQTKTTQTTTIRTRAHAPFMVINPGETLTKAEARHRRETGHIGSLIIVAINPGKRPHLAAA